MRYLKIGRTVLPLTDEVARSWPVIEKQARRDADRLGLLHPSISYRTDTGAFGVLSLTPEHPFSLTDNGEPTDQERGAIISASADPDQISREVRAEHGPDQELTDEQVHDRVRELTAERPDLDWDNILTGRLRGPATPDRPDLPVWDYFAYVDSHPDVELSDLASIRFPVRLFDGPWDVTSVDEELRPLSTAAGRPLQPRFVIDAEAVVRRYALLHDAGAIDWSPAERGIVHLRTPGANRAILHAWAKTLQPVK